MTFMPRMTAETRAIRTLRPLSWRRWPGVIADVWHVHGEAGGGGFYRAPDPRLVVFLGGGRGLRLRTDDGSPWQEDVSVMYVPAGVPLWSAFSESGDHAHLDLHLDSGPLRQRLCNQPRGALSRPRLANGGPQVHMLARMIALEGLAFIEKWIESGDDASRWAVKASRMPRNFSRTRGML